MLSPAKDLFPTPLIPWRLPLCCATALVASLGDAGGSVGEASISLGTCVVSCINALGQTAPSTGFQPGSLFAAGTEFYSRGDEVM